MANDEGETLDFGEMGMLDEEMLKGQPGPGDLATPEDGAGPLLESPEEEGEEEEEEEEEKPSLLERIRDASPFTVMLGLTLLAVVIAVVCLAMELSSYNWDFSANEYKESALAALALQSVPPSTTAAA